MTNPNESVKKCVEAKSLLNTPYYKFSKLEKVLFYNLLFNIDKDGWKVSEKIEKTFKQKDIQGFSSANLNNMYKLLRRIGIIEKRKRIYLVGKYESPRDLIEIRIKQDKESIGRTLMLCYYNDLIYQLAESDYYQNNKKTFNEILKNKKIAELIKRYTMGDSPIKDLFDYYSISETKTKKFKKQFIPKKAKFIS